MSRVAFVMSGGGAKGAFELGAADYLIRKQHLDPDVIVGVSTGALNAAMLAQGRRYDGLVEQLDKLNEVWVSLARNDQIYKTKLLGKLGMILFKRLSLYNNSPLRELIDQHVSATAIRNSGRKFHVGSVEFRTGSYVPTRETTSDPKPGILASTSIPVMFPSVVMGKSVLFDGGVRDITPLNAAIDMLKEYGEDDDVHQIVILLASPLSVHYHAGELKSWQQVLERTLAITLNEVYRQDISHAISINRLVDQYPDIKYSRYKFIVIQPDREVIEALDFDPIKIEAARKQGLAVAEDVWSKLENGEYLPPELLH